MNITPGWLRPLLITVLAAYGGGKALDAMLPSRAPVLVVEPAYTGQVWCLTPSHCQPVPDLVAGAVVTDIERWLAASPKCHGITMRYGALLGDGTLWALSVQPNSHYWELRAPHGGATFEGDGASQESVRTLCAIVLGLGASHP